MSKEIIDILYFTFRFAQMNDIDVKSEFEEKMKSDEEKYVVDKFKGSNKKYSDYKQVKAGGIMNVEDGIRNINEVICENIKLASEDKRGLFSQNILQQLRHFVEHMAIKIYNEDTGQRLIPNMDNITTAIAYIRSRGNYKFLSKFHKFLQASVSHYTVDPENSERLMLKYYEYLLRCKIFLEHKFGIIVLKNLSDFPLDTDKTFSAYYDKIAKKVNEFPVNKDLRFVTGRYYVQKIKPFFVDHNIFNEVTLTPANDNTSKFNRIIAFTKLDITENYSIKISFVNSSVNIFEKQVPIKVINNWEISVRPCEITNFIKILGKNNTVTSNHIEYKNTMRYLTKSGYNFVDIVDLEEKYYNAVKRIIHNKEMLTHIFDAIDICREIAQSRQNGYNVIRYLLFCLNNKVIKDQYNPTTCYKLSNLNLQYGCIPFEEMPFVTSLVGHNPKVSDLFDCLNSECREHEMLARIVKQNAENKGKLYTLLSELDGFDNLRELVKNYNALLYRTHQHRKMIIEGKNIYIKGYEEDTIQILEKLCALSKEGIKGYTKSVDYWLNTEYSIDCTDKEHIIRDMFEDSKLAMIYGSAGTGKTTVIKHVSNFFRDKSKIFLANTHPAVQNLRSRVEAPEDEVKTISKFLSGNNTDIECDILVIDECSTVSNKDMHDIIMKAKFELLVLVGDIYQIESINFGNWFDIAYTLVPEKSRYELTEPWRSKNKELQKLWDKVRKIDDKVAEYISKNGYSKTLDKTILESREDDEITLCYNYDGLYGINNINRFMQNGNSNLAVEWGIATYKEGDPILFNNSMRFSPLIYNNLKGIIKKIEIENDQIWFEIEIDKIINEMDTWGIRGLELVDNPDGEKSVVKFFVKEHRDTDDDDDATSNAIVPFSVAYAVSIHKAQGLEYDSVKLVITRDIEELISHNIFYTAITRARKKLRIYWTPECQKKILKEMEHRINRKDAHIISLKLNN